jgi:CRP-like cAMP-binding protein
MEALPVPAAMQPGFPAQRPNPAFSSRPRNRVLAALPVSDWERIAPQLRHTLLISGQTVQADNMPVERIYFPNAGVISLIAVASGAAIEVGAIGRESMLGAISDIESGKAFTRAVVQIPGNALWLPPAVLHEEFRRGGVIQSLLVRHNGTLWQQAARMALCNRLHSVEERLSRWLLGVRDRTDSETISVTHDAIAKLLGTRRSGVTVALGAFAEEGLIDTSRGTITLLDSTRLEARACECYRLLAASQELMPAEK